MAGSTARPRLLIVGAGGHAKVVIDLVRAAGAYDLVGLIDRSGGARVNGVAVIGSDADLPRLRAEGVTHAHVAIGDNARRLSLARELEAKGFTLANAISPAAVLAPSTRLGAGIAVMAGAVVNVDSRIGDAAILNTRASLDHDGTIGEGAHVAPGCALAGNVSVGRLAFLGVGTSVIPGIAIGDEAIVGAGSCVVRPVPPRARAYGVPARIVAS
jgi:UDP-perosamine 4-acetyltransferase